jgi:translation initiation factor IF-3
LKSVFVPGNPNVGRQQKPTKEAQRKHRINNEITAKEVRVVDSDGSMLGIMNVKDAIKIAEEREIDLVEIAPQANPPVCKLIDYGKFAYELQKKEKQIKKNSAASQMKEIRFKSRTATHDFNFKLKHARSFIEEGNKVKASVIFRGREIAHTDIGKELLEKFIEEMSDIAKVDAPLKFEGKNLSVILSPLKTKKAKPEKETKS